MDWLKRIDLSLEPDSGVEQKILDETNQNLPPDSVHVASRQQLRRTLMENQARMTLGMLDGVDDDDLVTYAAEIGQIRGGTGRAAGSLDGKILVLLENPPAPKHRTTGSNPWQKPVTSNQRHQLQRLHLALLRAPCYKLRPRDYPCGKSQY